VHDTIPTADCPFFLITSTPEGRHVVHASWPTSLPALTVTQDADVMSMFLFPLLHHTAPFRVYAHINNTGTPSAYRLKSVKREVDAAVLNGVHMVKETELLTALCALQRDLYYAVPAPPPLVERLPDIVEAIVVDVDDTFATTPLPPPPPPPCEGWVRPLRLAQHQALQWMRDLERAGARTLVLDPRVPISDTVAVDLLTHTLVCARTPASSATAVDINVGVLTGDRGAGKTAVALALALCHPAPLAPLTPYETLHLTPCPSTTLLVVPRHLLPCWKLEIKACFPGAHVLVMSSTRDARVTKAQVMAATLILTTDHVVSAIAAACAADQTHAQMRYFRTTATTPGGIVPLHAFKWGRVIVDEALRKNALEHARLHANWWWCLCADADKTHPFKLLEKLEFATGVPADSWAGSLHARTRFVAQYVHVLQQPERPVESWVDRVVWVELRPDEYMRYEAAKADSWSDERLLKLCCGATPQDQPGRFVQPQPLSVVAHEVAALHQTTMRALTEMHPDDLQVAEVTHAHFDKVVHELKQEVAPRQCPVCVEDACTILTTCGHTYCWTCMFRTFKGNSIAPCPYCRRLLTSSDVYQISPEGQDQGMGQKCAALIAMLAAILKDTPDRVVVYVAWYGLAQQLAAWLEKAGISVRALSSRGVESSLKAFESGHARVLVLPYDYGEGLTLVCANHVVIYHATSQKDTDIALASVNRTGQTKPIHVYRLIAKGTLEASMLTTT
jgi:hypothetical protein